MSIAEEGHANLLCCRLAGVADGEPMSAESRHDTLSIPRCPPERCGNRLLVREGEHSELKIVSFGQPTERLSTVNEATTGHYDGISTIWNGPPRQWTEAANQRSPYPIGDGTSEIGDGMEGWNHGHSFHSFNQSIPGHVLQGKKTRQREEFHRRKETQVVLFFYL